MSKPRIGFIGLGLMGGNMVENLQNKGFEPIVMDLNKEAVAAVVARGASVANSCLLYTSPSPRDKRQARMPSSA